MRLLRITLLTIVLILLGASIASAVEIRLEDGAGPNQVDVYLDMGADAGTRVNRISIGVETRDSDVTYLGAEPPPTLAAIADTPGIMLSFTPFAFLAPTPAYGIESTSLDVPRGSTRAVVEFFSATSTDGSISGNQNVLMATLNYDIVFAQWYDYDLVFGIDGGFFIDDGTEVVRADEMVNLVNNLALMPEPSTAILLGLGLAALGVAGRRNV